MSQATGVTVRPAAWRRRALLGAGVAVVALLVWSVVRLSGATGGVAMMVAAMMSGVTASLASQPVIAKPKAPADEALAPETLRRLRHDLRGILSPALMTADRLLMTTTDPSIKRTAEIMVETVERAEKRLAG